MYQQLPSVKKDSRRPNVKGLLGEIFNENSQYGRSTTVGSTLKPPTAHDDLLVGSVFS